MGARSEEAAIAAAARNNAAWCDLFAGLHGGRGSFTADAWTSPHRTPDRYPDAVTLRRSVDAKGLLSRIDDSPGASVKDSFADLDLAPWGFERLFAATWIRWAGRPVAASSREASPWEPVRNEADLRAWETAWGVPDGAPGVFPPGLLGRSDVVVLASLQGQGIGAGAILSEGGGVVGLSNVFVTDTARDAGAAMAAAFASAVAAARVRFPGRDLVAYEHGAELGAAVEAGFRPIGPLRVWIRR